MTPGFQAEFCGHPGDLGIVGDRHRRGLPHRSQNGSVQSHVERQLAPSDGGDQLTGTEIRRSDADVRGAHLIPDALTTTTIIEVLRLQLLHGNQQHRSSVFPAEGVQCLRQPSFTLLLDRSRSPRAWRHRHQGSGKIRQAPVQVGFQLLVADQPGRVANHQGVFYSERRQFGLVLFGAHRESSCNLCEGLHPALGSGVQEGPHSHSPYQNRPSRGGRRQGRPQIAGDVARLPAQGMPGPKPPLVRQQAPTSHDHHSRVVCRRQHRRDIGPIDGRHTVSHQGVMGIAGHHHPSAVGPHVAQQTQHPG